jgi:surface protein
MFVEASAFNNGDPSNNGSKPLIWDTSGVLNMNSMFLNASAFNQDVSFNTHNVTTMNSMFYAASAFNNGDPSNNGSKPLIWDTSGVLNMAYMFNDASSFNQDISGWNTGAVTDMAAMFYNATVFNNGDPSNNGSKPLNWDTSGVLNMYSMFYNASAFNQDVSFNTHNVTYMGYMFQGASAFNNGDPSNNGSKPLIWDTSGVLDMSYMFQGASTFNQDVSFNTHNVTTMGYTFNGASAFNNGDPSNNGSKPLTWDTSGVLDMSYMFYGASSFNQSVTYDPSHNYWNTSNVQNMDGLFYNATNFNNGDESQGINQHMNWIVGQFSGATPTLFSYGSSLTYNPGNSPFSTDGYVQPTTWYIYILDPSNSVVFYGNFIVNALNYVTNFYNLDYSPSTEILVLDYAHGADYYFDGTNFGSGTNISSIPNLSVKYNNPTEWQLIYDSTLYYKNSSEQWNQTSTQYTFVFSLNPYVPPVPYDGAPLSPSNKLSATTIDISSNVTNIGQGAFLGCSILQTINGLSNVATMGPYAFTGCVSLQTIDLSVTSLTYVPSNTFLCCTLLQSVTLSDASTNSLDESAFAGCVSLNTIGATSGTISIPSSTGTIGALAFEGCTSITIVDASNVNIQASGQNGIGKWAFIGCIKMTSINLPESSPGGFPAYNSPSPDPLITWQQYWGIPFSCTVNQVIN